MQKFNAPDVRNSVVKLIAFALILEANLSVRTVDQNGDSTSSSSFAGVLALIRHSFQLLGHHPHGMFAV